MYKTNEQKKSVKLCKIMLKKKSETVGTFKKK